MEARNPVGAARRRDLTLHVEFRLVTHFIDNSLIVAPLNQDGDPPWETGLVDRDDLIAPVRKFFGDKSTLVLGFEAKVEFHRVVGGSYRLAANRHDCPLREWALRCEVWMRFSTMHDFKSRERGETKATREASHVAQRVAKPNYPPSTTQNPPNDDRFRP